MGVEPKIGGKNPKWMVKIMVPKPIQIDDFHYKPSILIGFSIINHSFWGKNPIFGNTQISSKHLQYQPRHIPISQALIKALSRLVEKCYGETCETIRNTGLGIRLVIPDSCFGYRLRLPGDYDCIII